MRHLVEQNFCHLRVASKDDPQVGHDKVGPFGRVTFDRPAVLDEVSGVINRLEYQAGFDVVANRTGGNQVARNIARRVNKRLNVLNVDDLFDVPGAAILRFVKRNMAPKTKTVLGFNQLIFEKLAIPIAS